VVTLVLYDGVCGLCDTFVHFLLRRDDCGIFRFAPLQSDLAHAILTARGRNPDNLDTVYVVAAWRTPDERLYERSQAILHVVGRLGGFWTTIAAVARIVPRPVADAVYRLVARVRYRLFGKMTACPIPPREWVQRFIDRSEG
jgi:predicted DCC family thiol-disulfide oxidoreductase YuxK